MSQVIINDVPPYTQATAILNQVVFGTNWTANAASDVIVYVTPVGTQPDDFTNILDYPSEYTVDFIGALQEVQVTLVTPSAAGDIVTIIRMTPADRENLYSNTNFLPSMLNNDFGILTLVDQQAQLVNQKIAPRYNYSAHITDVVDTILPTLEANQTWIKNNDNTGFIALTIQGGQVGSGVVNIGSQNQIAYYAANGDEVSGLSGGVNSVLVTNFAGVPGMSDSLPNDMTAFDMLLNTPVITGGTITDASLVNPTLSSAQLGTPDSGTLTHCTGLPSGTGILCTSTNNDASAGQLGEFKSSVISGASPVSCTRNASTNLTSISLTAGDWDVWGNITWVNLGTAPLSYFAWTSTSSGGSLPDASLRNGFNSTVTTLNTAGNGISTPYARYSLSTTTPIYLNGFFTNGSGNGTFCGAIYARRVR